MKPAKPRPKYKKPAKRAPGRKGLATRQKLIDAAAVCLARYGEGGTTFQNIADLCGVSQTLVIHYFKRRENIFLTVVEERMRDTQERSQRRIDAASSPLEKLAAYLALSIEIFREHPENEKLYLILTYLGGFDDGYRKLNTSLRNKAVERITRLIEDGANAGVFRTESPVIAAKVIHNSLIGNLLAQTTESRQFTDGQLLAGLLEFCQKLLQV